MAVRYANPIPQYFTDNGVPLSGGKLQFYQPGTTTPKNTFSDNALSVPNTNPVILDAFGRVPDIFLDGAYRVMVKDSDDVQIADLDNVNSSAGGALQNWDASVSYSIDDIVYASDGNYYISLVNDNIGNEPSASPSEWEQIQFLPSAGFTVGWQSVSDTGYVTTDAPAFTADATENTHRLAVLASNTITIPAGTTPLVSTAYFVEPNITATGTVTTAATVYIKDAPTEGGSNYALFVDAGNVRFDGALTLGTDLAIADGGTGASTASGARTNLGLGTAATVNTGTTSGTVPLNGAAASFTTLNATSGVITDPRPSLILDESDASSDFNRSELAVSSGVFQIVTRTDADAQVSQDYLILKDAAGATEHQWRLANTEKLSLNSTGLNVVDDLNVGGAILADGIVNSVNTAETTISGGNNVGQGASILLRGGAHPTEAGDMRIRTGGSTRLFYDSSASLWDITGDLDVSGDIFCGKSAVNLGDNGFYVDQSAGTVGITRDSGGGSCLNINREDSDGTLVAFYQASSLEGNISVSGTTVSYNGAHLSRWSQLPKGGKEEILRGTVLSNVNKMCEWGDEDNEQLNRMKVSDKKSDVSVAGVFQGWDDDDSDDFYCAMTGDFIIRISKNVKVKNGDLLESAGDGTAKPQSDDFIRSSTVAKVTSATVTCTYDDGSYCVPCVLMAC